MNSINHHFTSYSKIFKFLILSLTVGLLSIPLQAQISQGGEPASFHLRQFAKKEVSYSPKIPFGLNKSEGVSKQCTAYKYGEILPFERSLRDPDFGTKTVDKNGNTIWKASITSKNALALGLYFSNLYLPKGAKLFIYSPDKSQVIGAFTDLNNSKSGLFATELIYGDKLIIEYDEPASAAGLGHFKIDEITHAYRGISDFKNGFGASGDCEVNVNCTEGTSYAKQKNSVVRLSIKSGGSTYWCTGSIINNANNDLTPYVLTADHCGIDATVSELTQWVIYFNYESDSCDNPSVEPASNTMTGATKIAASSNAGIMGSDFYLVLLNQNIPESYNAYFMGWDRSGASSHSGATIHHPEGDIKKISTYNTDLVSSTYSSGGFTGSTNGSWEVVWSETADGHGVTEGGSSGSPLYSQAGYLIGTLTGGWASCSTLTDPDYYGKFNYHWDKNGTTDDTQLKPWLDPNNTGLVFLSGIPVGIEEIGNTWDNIFTLFPNPSDGKITIRFNESGYGKAYSIRVSNMLGQSVYNDKLTIYYHLDLNLQYLQKGVYFIDIEGENQRQTQKISIQ